MELVNDSQTRPDAAEAVSDDVQQHKKLKCLGRAERGPGKRVRPHSQSFKSMTPELPPGDMQIFNIHSFTT